MGSSKIAKVLIVDDLACLREVIETALISSVGREIEILHANNAIEAISILSLNKISVVVSDLEMPGGDGLELLRLKSERALTTPTIIFSASHDLEGRELLKKGAVAYFSKLGGLDQLVSEVSKHL